MSESKTQEIVNTNIQDESQHHESSLTKECTIYDVVQFSATDDSVTAEKKRGAIKVTNSLPGQPLSADEQSPSGTHPSKYRFWQFSPAKRIVTAIHGDCEDLRNGEDSSRPWRTSFIRFGPLSGIFGMFLALASLVASLGILAGSDAQLVSSWSIPPSTYLAIFTAIANLSVRYAAVQGAVIAWWFRASRGSTLAKLHSDWRSGTTLRGALTSGRHMGLLALACIFSIVVVIDGPLLQRSSSVVSAHIVDHPVPLNISMAPQIPRDYTGYWAPVQQIANSVQYAFSFNATVPGPNGPVSNLIFAGGHEFLTQSVIRPWLRQDHLANVVHGCPRKCKAKIHAPALFATQCATHLLPVNYPKSEEDEDLIFNNHTAPPLVNNAFTVATVLDVSGQRESINLFTGYATVDDCIGTYNYTTCTLEPGIGEYDISIAGNKVKLNTPTVPKYVSLAKNAIVNNAMVNNTLKTGGVHPSTLANVVEEMKYQWGMDVAYLPVGEDSVTEVVIGSIAAYEIYALPTPGDCTSWRDPRDDVMESLNSLMFYIGAHAANKDPDYLASHMDPGLEIHPSITGYLEGEQNVFQTDYWFFLGAAIVEVVCIAFVAPTYWGWWKLGRPCSFSPLEMAKAFESPMLAECNSNSSGRDLAKVVGDVQVRYGAVGIHEKDELSRIKFDVPERVSYPGNGTRFDA